MTRRYDIRTDGKGWMVFDIFTGQPVVILEVPQVGLNVKDARDLAELLNGSEMRNRNLLQ